MYPGGKPTLVVLANGHGFKLPSECFYSQISASLSLRKLIFPVRDSYSECSALIMTTTSSPQNSGNFREE